jgi:outer membrane protein assembly factor BamB
MTSQQLLELIDQRRLVPSAVVAKLRAQLADPAKRASPKALAKLLVDKGHLTASQAKQLLNEAVPPADSADDLGFALIDDEPPPVPATQTAAKKPKVAPEVDSRLAGKGSVRDAWRVEDTPRPRDAQPADDLLGDLLAAPLGPSTVSVAPRSGRWPWSRSATPRHAGDPWDSPLLLLGGGGLVALILLGGFLYWRIGRGNADDWLEKAEAAYRDQAYGAAAEQYTAFVERFPSHDRASFARVQAGMAKLRQASAGNASWPQALALASDIVPSISGEADFASGRDELTSILPAISEGLAQQARQAADKAAPELPPNEAKPLAAQAQTRLDEAKQSLTLVERYVVAAQRPAQRMRDIDLMLATTARDVARTAELESTVADIEQSMAKGDLNAAYDARRKLLREHPALVANKALAAHVQQLGAGMLKAAKTEKPNRAAETTEAPSAVLGVAVPWQLTAAAAGGDRRFAPLLADGVAYGVDAASGKLLWRRYVGAGATSAALPVDGDTTLALLADVARQELLALDRWTGKLAWRQPLAARPFDPVLAGTTALVATETGQLDALDSSSGRLLRETVLPQPPAAPPAAGAQRPNCYVVADHSNLYTVEIASGTCREVTYVGHELGSVRVAPALVLRYVLVAENHLTEASRLHVFVTDAQGGALKLAQQIPLAGWVTTPMAVSGSRVVVATDRGGLYVFEARDQSAQPLAPVAERPATSDPQKDRWVSAREGRIVVADDRLTLFELQAARGRLDPRWVEQLDMAALQAPLLAQNSVLSVARPAKQPTVSIAALGYEKGALLWQAWLQPAAGGLVTRQTQVVAVGTRGDLFAADGKDLGVATSVLKPRATAIPPALAPLSQLEQSASNQLVATSAERPQTPLVVDETLKSAQWLELPDVQPATPPVCFGDGLLVADARGQVHWLSLAGKRLAQPFQPPQAAGARIEWKAPATLASIEQGVILADGGTRLFRVAVNAKPQARLVAAATADLVEPIVSAVAAVGDTAYALDSGGWLRSYATDDLRPKEAWHLNARAVWGPAKSGNHVYLTTDADELLCLDAAGELKWRVPLEHGPLAGAPLETAQGVVLISTRGQAWRVAGASGKELARAELSQPAASGAVVVGNRWVVAGRDGAFLSLAPF